MTELSFLIELLMNHRLQKVTKEFILSRIKEVEANLNARPAPYQRPGQDLTQAASTRALLDKHGPLPSIEMPPIPVEQIAQTPATAAAMLSRQQAISQALSGKIDKGQTSPRKF